MSDYQSSSLRRVRFNSPTLQFTPDAVAHEGAGVRLARAFEALSAGRRSKTADVGATIVKEI